MKDDSFSVGVILRILSILSDEGNMKRTALAGRARLQYNALIRYSSFLKKLRWIEYSAGSSNLMSITSLGRSCRKLLEDEDAPSDISEEILGELLAQTEGKQSDAEKKLICSFCGNTIKRRPVTKELEGKTYSFDRRECASLFTRFMDVYGKEFFSNLHSG